MVARVIPIAKLPFGNEYFDYLIPKNLLNDIKSGCLVTIPFRNKEIFGLVYDLKKISSFNKLKPIKNIVQTDFVRPYQFELIKWFSAYYHISWSTVLKNFLPPKPKRKVNIKNYQPPYIFFPYQKNTNFSSSPIDKIKHLKKISLILLNDYSQNLNFIKSLIKQNKKNFVFFFPTIENLSAVYYSLDSDIRADIKVVTGELNKTQYWSVWQDVLKENKNKKKIIFCTRRGIFLPFPNNTTFIITQGENNNHKQSDLTPRFSVINVIEKIINFNKKNLLITSYFPKIEHYTQAKLSRWTLINWQSLIKNLIFIDLNSVSYEYSPLINENLINKIKNKERILMYLNRKGDFTLYKCTDCHYVAFCENCRNPLKFYQQKNELKCHYCGFSVSPPEFCPLCHGVNLKGLGSGIKNIEKIAKKIFPDHKILLLDSETENRFNELNSKYIVLGTDFVLNKVDNTNFDQVIFLNSDLDLIAHNFRSLENTSQKYISLIRITNCPIIIQTYNLKHPVWLYIRRSYDYFWKQEIKNRKRYNYPPFVKLLKLIYSDSDKQKTINNINVIYKDLQKYKDLYVSSPQQSLPFKKHRKYSMYILIKYKNKIDDLLNKLPPEVIVDHDPEII